MSRFIILVLGFIAGWFIKDSNWEEWLEQIKSFFDPAQEKADTIPLFEEKRSTTGSDSNQIFPDSLEKLTGIGPAIKKKLNDNGIYTFQQVASLTPDALKTIVGSRVKVDAVIKEAKSLTD